MKKNDILKRILSITLAIAMVFTMISGESSKAFAESIPGSSVDNPINVNFGKHYSKEYDFGYSYGSKSDISICKIVLSKRGVLTLNSFKPYANEELCDAEFQLYDESGMNLLWRYKSNNSDKENINSKYVAKVGLNPGTYYIGFSISRDSYDHIWGETQYWFDFEENQNCEVESNNSFNSATKLEPNRFVKVFYGNNDDDYLKFMAEKGQEYRITAKNIEGFFHELYNPTGDEEYSFDIYDKIDSEGNNYTTFVAKEDGWHYLFLNGEYSQVTSEIKVSKNVIIPTLPDKAIVQLDTNSGGYDDVNLYWTKSRYAAGYYVYYKKASDSKYKYYTKTKIGEANFKDLEDGTKYIFAIRPYYYDENNNIKPLNKYLYKSIYTLKKVSAPKVYKYKNGYVKVNWSNIYGESGYQISRSTSKTGTYVVATKSYKNNSAILGARKNVGYYYKVRAYRIIDGQKVYAPWSMAKYYKAR